MPVSPLRAFLLTLLARNFDGGAWYGGSLLTALKKTDATTAARRVGTRKTIWEQCLHAAYWKYVVLRRVSNDAKSLKFPRKGSGWPRMPISPDDAAWVADVELLRSIQMQLLDAVRALPEKRLLTPAMHKLIEGAAAHDVYHNGQIRLLKRLLSDDAD